MEWMYTKNGTIRTKWFFSYVLVLIIPILLSIGIYSYASYTAKVQTNKVNDASMEQLKMEMDGRSTEIYKLFDQISLDRNVQILTNAKQTFSANDQFNLYTLSNDLKSYQLSYDFIEDTFIYFNNTGTALSKNGHMSGEELYQLYYENENYNLQQFQNLMAQNHVHDIYLIHKTNGKNDLLFLQTTLKSGIGDSSATIAVCMDESKLESFLQNIKWDDQSIICILDGKNHVVSSTDPFLMKEELDYDRIGQSSGLTFQKIRDINYVVSLTQSDVVDWKYITFTPDYIFERNARNIQIFSVIGLFFCIFIGMGAAYELARRNYNPLKDIVDMFKKYGREVEKNADANEFQWLKEAAQNIFKAQEDNEKVLWSNKRLLKNYYLFKLLESGYDEKEFQEYLRKNDMMFRGAYNQVVLFFLNYADNISPISEDDYQSLKMSQFIVINMFEEVAGNHFNVVMTDVGEQAAAIVNFPEKDENLRSTLEEDIYFVQQKAMEYFSLNVVASLGGVQEGMGGIHDSYKEAREAAEYLSHLSGQDIIYYDDVKNTQQKYFYPMESEQKIINAIEAGNSAAANEFISQVFEKNFVENNISTEMGRCILYDMVGTIIKGVEMSDCSQLLEQFELTKEISHSESIQKIRFKIEAAVNAVCQSIREKQEDQNNNKQLSQDIIAYIDGNYQDPDLNISLTAMHFDMTPAYLSSLFKKQVGKNLLEYINTVRIGAARELLQKGYSVVEVSGMVGFRDSGAMIRVFKKITGVTPGQMKKTL